MAETMQTAAQSLIERAAKIDPILAADIRAFAQQREFGLVFEHNRPEQMRLYGKPIAVGDTVQMFPPRGEKEGASSKVMWSVCAITDGMAALSNDSGASAKAAVEDLVAVAEYDQPIYAGLKETGRVERGGDKPYQVVINGENYHALESLLFCYAGKVDCIYIDPPYNTGARDWKYNNDYVGDDDAYRHSKWLAFMERRLKLAKQLLNPLSSMLIVTIDEKEIFRLALLLEQIFPGFSMQTITIAINKNGVARGSQFKRAEEYALCIFIGAASPCRVNAAHYTEHPEEATKSEKGSVRWERLMRGGPNAPRSHAPNLFYPIYIDPKNKTISKIGDPIPFDMDWREIPGIDGLKTMWPVRVDGREATWRISKKTFIEKLEKGFARVGAYDQKNDRYSILYLPNIQEQRIESGEIAIVGKSPDESVQVEQVGTQLNVPTTIWTGKQFSAGEYGSRYIKKFLGDRAFTYPKSLYAVERSLETFVADKPDALVLDFFSGSGTTAHALMRLNHNDGGKRRCICVTNNEVSEMESKRLLKKGLRQGDKEWEKLGICEYITKPRITAAITGQTPAGIPINGDYKFVDEFPMAEGLQENVVFFDLTYEEPDAVELGGAFSEIAPLLWMRAGCEGKIILNDNCKFAFSDHYGILFNYSSIQDFAAEAKKKKDATTLFIVTDDEARYANLKKTFPNKDVVRLYESYLRSFKIAAEGALN